MIETNRTVGGVDTTKRVFQLHWVVMETSNIVNFRMTWTKVLKHYANHARTNRGTCDVKPGFTGEVAATHVAINLIWHIFRVEGWK